LISSHRVHLCSHISPCVLPQVGNIENEYRVFQMDVIAGKPVLETEVKQHSARFKLDYSQVQCATSRPFYL